MHAPAMRNRGGRSGPYPPRQPQHYGQGPQGRMGPGGGFGSRSGPNNFNNNTGPRSGPNNTGTRSGPNNVGPRSGPNNAGPSPRTGPNNAGPRSGPNIAGPKSGPNTNNSNTGPKSGPPTTGPKSGPTTGPKSGPTTGPKSGPTTGPKSGPNTTPKPGPNSNTGPDSGTKSASSNSTPTAPRSGPNPESSSNSAPASRSNTSAGFRANNNRPNTGSSPGAGFRANTGPSSKANTNTGSQPNTKASPVGNPLTSQSPAKSDTKDGERGTQGKQSPFQGRAGKAGPAGMMSDNVEDAKSPGFGRVSQQRSTDARDEVERHAPHGDGDENSGRGQMAGRGRSTDFGGSGEESGKGRGRGRGRFMDRGDAGDGANRGRSAGRGRSTDRRDRPFNLDQPQVSLEDALPPSDKKFTGRCRLFVGNLPTDMTEDKFREMFSKFGEFTEVFLNASKGFGFIRMDYRKNAEAAKAAMDGVQTKNRTLRVRFATHGAALKVKYLPAHVTNELLAQAFSIFGELERAVVIVDDRGKSVGEGIVEFARKPGAQAALKRITEGVFLMGASPRPIVVEPFEQKDEEDGFAEKYLPRSGDVVKEREEAPRFAAQGSFQFEFGLKWKELFQIHEEQKVNLQQEFEAAMGKLEVDQAGAQMEHHTQLLRQDLLRRQEELQRLEEMHQIELQKRMDMRLAEDQRRRLDEERRREEMNVRRQQQEERRQQDLYTQQQRAARELRELEMSRHQNTPPLQPPPALPPGLSGERGSEARGAGLSSMEQAARSAAMEGSQDLSRFGSVSGVLQNAPMITFRRNLRG